MQLEVMDRLLLNQVLPERGNLATLKIVRELREELSFSEEEHKAFEITTDAGKLCPTCGHKPTGNVRWSADKGKLKEIGIGPEATKMICAGLKLLEKQEQLTEQHRPLWDEFVGENGEQKKS